MCLHLIAEGVHGPVARMAGCFLAFFHRILEAWHASFIIDANSDLKRLAPQRCANVLA